MHRFMYTSSAIWQDYWVLCKPRVVALMLLTAAVGMALAPVYAFPWKTALVALWGIALVSAGAAALNHLFDEQWDKKMRRTQYRPLPQQRLRPQDVQRFAVGLACSGLFCLYYWVNPLTALLTGLSMIGYAVIYTRYLKHWTPQNIVIGGATGAIPPLLGWTAITGTCDPQPWLLVLIIYAWTPPHFWALAVYKQEEYAQAGIPMLPVTHGLPFTYLNIFLYTCLLTAATCLPYALGMSGLVYFLAVTGLNGVFLYKTWDLYCYPSRKKAWNIFQYSIYYLMWLFCALLADHWWMLFQ